MAMDDYQPLPLNFINGKFHFGNVPNFTGEAAPAVNPVNNFWANNKLDAMPYQRGVLNNLGGVGTPAQSQGMFGGLFDNFLTKGDQQGWGNMAVGVGQGLANAYMGMKQYGLAKDTFEQNKKQFEMNYANQTKLTNSRLQDRQAARVASNPGAYQSVGDYMKQNGV